MASPAPSPPANNTAPPPANSTSPPPAANTTSPPPAANPPPAATAPPPATNTTAPPPTKSTPLAPPPTNSTTPSTPPRPSPSSPPPAASSPPLTTSPPPPSSTGSPPPASSAVPPPASATPPPPSTPSPPGARSPPSPPTTRSPPTTPSSPSSPRNDSGSNVSTGLVIGVAIAGVAALVILSVLCVCCTKKRRRRRYDEDFYYPPPPPPPAGPKDGPYAPQPYRWQTNPPPPDQLASLPPQPSPPAPSKLNALRQSPSPGHPQMPPPPPPPPFMSSSGGSGSNYSGSGRILPPPSPAFALGFSKSTFTYEELSMATDSFSDANLLGQGGFGYVHKGVLPNGKEVAVKSLKAESGQGEREFQAEVEIISRVHHKHLVSLVGYCITGAQRMLVYEFVPNNTLEFHLHGRGRPTMDWPTRIKIALGSAKGLAYLHEDCNPKIIHRDIKASNILLDFKFEAKVADFGLAKIASDAYTHVSTRVMGTFGYLAPEYASSGKLSDKSDVFSFGVMLLELITGRRPVDTSYSFMEDSLVDWARPLLTQALENGNFDALIDPRLQNDYNHDEMARMVSCAAACVRHSARRRPRMSQIVRALDGDVSLTDLSEGLTPGHSSVYSYGSSEYDSMQYKEDMRKFKKIALTSQEYGASSEYSEPTSEYGVNPSGSSSEGQHTREMEMGKMKDNTRGFRS